MIILDTDCLSILERESGEEFLVLRRNLSRFNVEDIATTIISFDEQMRGWMSVVARANSVERLVITYAKLDRFLDRFRQIPTVSFDEEAGVIFADLKKQHPRIGTMDLRIASIVMARNAILVSRNLVDFERIPGLAVEDWTREGYIN